VRHSVIVIDDFYEDADEVRRMALDMDYPEFEKDTNYPGSNSVQKFLPEGLDDIASELTHEKLIGNETQFHGNFRISLGGHDELRVRNIHVDPNVHWSGILYLTEPEHCRGGTEFYRHLPTGTDRGPIYQHELEEWGVESYAEAVEGVLLADTNDDDKWEHLMTVPMRHNRLILIRPYFWHTSGPSFGSGFDDGRLVQLFFFSKIG